MAQSLHHLSIKLDKEYISGLRDIINREIESLSLPKSPSYIYEPISYALSGGGKRLRPILLYLTGEALGVNKEDLKYAGLAVELLHNFTLVHDDIMDQDDVRHGKHTIHKKWDTSTAILAGDGIYVLSLSLISQVNVHPLKVIKTFNDAALMVCEGQAYDKQYENDINISMDDYLVMIEKKTGYLIGLCTELAGILAGKNDKVVQALRLFGNYLGTAFQIQDDLLEIFANEKQMGKSLGSDLTKGKQTILSILAREKNYREWDELNSNFDDMGESIRKQKLFIKENKIIDKVEKMIHSYIDKAINMLDNVPESCNSSLTQFTDLILTRDH